MHSGQQPDCRLNNDNTAQLRLVFSVCLLALALPGCQSHTVHVLDLPPEAIAPPVENAQTVDLSRLAAPTLSSERIDYGDILDVTVSTGYDNRLGREGSRTFPVRVTDEGDAKIPLIGYVPVAGLELEAAEQAIATVAVERSVYNDPHVTVMMNRQRVNLVTVVGAVEEQGVKQLPRRSSWLLAAIVAAGGLSEDASATVRIRLPGRRPKTKSPNGSIRQTGLNGSSGPSLGSAASESVASAPRTIELNLFDAARDGTDGYYLEDGAFVEIVRRDPRPVSVLGLVRKPDKYELPVGKEFYLLDALAVAGGVSSSVANKIHIIRRVPTLAEPIVIEVGYREAKSNHRANLRLAEGDIISVEQTTATVLYDTIRSFVRFGVSSSIPLF